eukprot:Gb_08333 [translate_table: standard]
MAAQFINEWQQSGYAGGEAQRDGDCVATLLVRHLPEALPTDTLMRLFSHYGASAVRPCAAGRLKNCAFVDFKDEGVAAQAQSQLNRLRLLGKVLLVERAKPLTANQSKNVPEAESHQEAPLLPQYTPSKENQPLVGDATSTVASQASIFGGEPIAPSLGVDYSFPPHLEYAYPPPDGNILTNIVNALIAVPRFYTQVLHLMNKMNLPAPFRPALPTPPLPPPLPARVPPRPQIGDLSSDESELESSDEGDLDDRKAPVGNTSMAEFERKTLRPLGKRPKREAVVGSAVGKIPSHDAAGAKPTSLIPKEVPTIKKRQPILQIKITPKGLPNESMQDSKDIGDIESEQVKDEHPAEKKSSATQVELEAGKLPRTEILALPMFKNYTPGNPTPVLYIKNLGKDVVVDDLYYVFGSLFKSAEEVKSGLAVKLMQEGRMRGQAFLTFPSTELANHALKMAHGFVLKGKPMIIQFGRNPSSGKNT